MNTNIQNLIRSFSPEKRKEIQQYVIANMSDEIREATLHGSVTPEMQKELENFIIKYLEIHYPEDIKHTITQSKNEVEEQISNLVDKQLDLMAIQPVDEPQTDNAKETPEEQPVNEKQYGGFLFNMGGKVRSTLATINPPLQAETPVPVQNEPVKNEPQATVAQTVQAPVTAPETSSPVQVEQTQQPQTVAQAPNSDNAYLERVEEDGEYYDDTNLLGENTGFLQRHDHENRFFGLQRKIYNLLALTDDESAESYFKIVMVIGGIMVFLGAWNLFNDFTTISSMRDYYYTKNGIYMRQLAEFCQTSMSNIKQFQTCVTDRQAELILNRRLDAVKDFLVVISGFGVVFISYFLKLNYRGREAYLNREGF